MSTRDERSRTRFKIAQRCLNLAKGAESSMSFRDLLLLAIALAIDTEEHSVVAIMTVR